MTVPLFSEVSDDTPTIPVPPLRLRRVRLQGVGPDGARFDPLDLDFTTRDGAAARVLMSLTNTGGKSTLITLLCSLIVPNARSQVGGKVLGDYVLTGDTSHVVCEWEDATSGRRTVTGTVMEWKDGRRQPPHASRSTSNMHRAWYLFHTGPGLPGLDDLPFIVDGRRLPYRDFWSAVDGLIEGNPGTQGVLTNRQQEWTGALEERTSVDPTLFGYQMRMNDSEAGAEKLLASFDSPDNVVRFFVAALNDQRELETFTGKLEEYAALAARRDELEAIAGFGAEIAPAIDLLVDKAAAAEAASSRARQVRMRGGEHAAAVANRLEQDTRSLAELAARLEQLRAEAVKARRAYGQISDIRQQLLLEEARARLASAERAVEEASGEATRASTTEQAWQAVDVVIDLITARERRDTARIAYDAADAGIEPLRARTSRAAAQVAGRLEELIDDADEGARLADAAAADATAAAQRAREDAEDAALQLQAIVQELTSIGRQIEAAEKARTAAVSAGWLADSETPTACVRRWQDARGEANAAAERADVLLAESEDAFKSLRQQIKTADGTLVQLRGAAQTTASEYQRLTSDLAAVGADETVVQLLGDQPVTPGQLARAEELARHSARAADERAGRHDAKARAAREELAQLDAAGTAPAGPDALAVQAVLTEERIGAVTGLSWIERNIADPGRRAPFIASHPELAGGVIISDTLRFADGVAILEERNVRTRTPVTVTTTPTSTSTSGVVAEADESTYVVVPHRATWDREWAERTRGELEEAVRTEGGAATDALAAAVRFRNATAMCADFLRRWGHTTAEDLEVAAGKAAAAVEDAEIRRGALAEEQDTEWTRAQQSRQEGTRQRRLAAMADRHVAEAIRLATTTADAETAVSRRDGLVLRQTRAKAARQAAQDRATDADREFKSQVARASDVRTAADAWRLERGAVNVDETAPAVGTNLDVLREVWNELREQLTKAEQGMTEAAALDNAEREVSKIRTRMGRFDAHVIAEAEFLATTVEASAQASRTGAQRRAADANRVEQLHLIEAGSERDKARDHLRDAAPAGADRQNFIDLSTTDWEPVRPEEIPVLLERLEIRNNELREVRDQADRAEHDMSEYHNEVGDDIESFTDTLILWIADRTPATAVFTGTRTQARDLMRDNVRDQREADRIERGERDALREAVNAVRGAASATRWAGLEAPAAIRVRTLAESDLVAEAEVLARRIRAMATSAAADLSELDEHRAILRDTLLSLCRDQRRMLREVSRYSKLPGSRGDLSQQPAIRIRFEEAPDDEAAGRLAGRIDTWAVELAGNPKRAKSSEIRARWLADAVRDTVLDRARAGAWSIDILKPAIDGRVLYCPPERIPVEFSGGQVLTLAVLVYCALSRVRSAHRQGGPRPAGTLLLDNPFGAASAEALIEMQHRLAAHSGVQLVCATGLHDPAVDAAFTGPGAVIVKLRNDGDLRRNLSFLRLRAAVVDGIDVQDAIIQGRDRTSTRNWVDGTRYEVGQ